MNKHSKHGRSSTLLVLLSVTMLLSSIVAARPEVWLAAAEQEPYIGTKLPQNGYVHELVTAAFERVGYATRIDFFPLARAQCRFARQI